MRRRTLWVVLVVVVAALGIGAGVWATRGDDCETTVLSVTDPDSPRTMKVNRGC
jgi:hypothetical protein